VAAPPPVEPPVTRPVTGAVAPPEVETRIDPVAPEVPEPVAVAPASDVDAVAERPPPAEVAPSEPTVVSPGHEDTVVERGLALLYAQRLDEVVALAQGALSAIKSTGTSASPAGSDQDAARLWGLVGLAKQGLNDLEGARFAFEEAIAVASGTERPTWEGHLVSLALAVGRRRVAAVATAPAAERVASLTSAIEWLERGLAADAMSRFLDAASMQEAWREAAGAGSRAARSAGLGLPISRGSPPKARRCRRSTGCRAPSPSRSS